MNDLPRSHKGSKKGKSKVQSMLEYVVQYDARPLNLELIPGAKGKGCYVSEYKGRGRTQPSVIKPNSKVISINDLNVETQPFDTIQMILLNNPMPLRLHLHYPNIQIGREVNL